MGGCAFHPTSLRLQVQRPAPVSAMWRQLTQQQVVFAWSLKKRFERRLRSVKCAGAALQRCFRFEWRRGGREGIGDAAGRRVRKAYTDTPQTLTPKQKKTFNLHNPRRWQPRHQPWRMRWITLCKMWAVKETCCKNERERLSPHLSRVISTRVLRPLRFTRTGGKWRSLISVRCWTVCRPFRLPLRPHSPGQRRTISSRRRSSLNTFSSVRWERSQVTMYLHVMQHHLMVFCTMLQTSDAWCMLLFTLHKDLK